MILTFVVILLLLIEISLRILITNLRKSFGWLVTEKDEKPIFDPTALEKFLVTSYDPILGWVRKPNSSGTEQSGDRITHYNIGSDGARKTSWDSDFPKVAVFGDSFAFCRQVEDDETWEFELSKRTKSKVLNYGVGNYGLDQSLLRYENLNLPNSIKFVIMCFVPETICRIQSYWKHYLEFGNTFAFKPMFVLDSEKTLSIMENPMRIPNDFFHYTDKLSMVQDADRFYKEKFRQLQFRSPYTLSFLKHPLFHGSLVSTIILEKLKAKILGSVRSKHKSAFKLIMKRNIGDANRYYGEEQSRGLLVAILRRFNDFAESKSHLPIVVVIPQLLDLRISKGRTTAYQSFYVEIASEFVILDLTEAIRDSDYELLYTNDGYGGHLSPEGNRFVAKVIHNWLITNSKVDFARKGQAQ